MSNLKGISQVLRQIIRENGWDDKINKQKLYIAWDTVMGPAVAKHTESIFLQGRKLVIKIDSAPLKHELSMQRSRIIDLLKEETGMDMVDIVVIR
jgi:predicted nucleic acid-binding Zn ribbon protein